MLDLNQVGTVNLIYSYNFQLGKSSKFVFSAGYAIPVTDKAYELKTIGMTLTETSKEVIDLMQPGGVILGIKILFGVE